MAWHKLEGCVSEEFGV